MDTNTQKLKTRKAKAPKQTVVAAADGQTLAIASAPATEVPPAVAAKAATTAKPAKATKATKEKKVSPTAEIRAAMANDPQLGAEDIKTALAKRGINPPMTTINTVRADFLGCLKALSAAGRIKSH